MDTNYWGYNYFKSFVFCILVIRVGGSNQWIFLFRTFDTFDLCVDHLLDLKIQLLMRPTTCFQNFYEYVDVHYVHFYMKIFGCHCLEPLADGFGSYFAGRIFRVRSSLGLTVGALMVCVAIWGEGWCCAVALGKVTFWEMFKSFWINLLQVCVFFIFATFWRKNNSKCDFRISGSTPTPLLIRGSYTSQKVAKFFEFRALAQTLHRNIENNIPTKFGDNRTKFGEIITISCFQYFL